MVESVVDRMNKEINQSLLVLTVLPLIYIEEVKADRGCGCGCDRGCGYNDDFWCMHLYYLLSS